MGLGFVLFYFFFLIGFFLWLVLSNCWCLFRSRQRHGGFLCMQILMPVWGCNGHTPAVQNFCISTVLVWESLELEISSFHLKGFTHSFIFLHGLNHLVYVNMYS